MTSRATTQRYDLRKGTERISFHVAGPCDQALIVASGAIRVWYIEAGELVMPPRDVPAGQSCEVKGGKPFRFAALSPNTVVFHTW